VDTSWTAARIDARRSTGAAKDNWETRQLHAVPFSPVDVPGSWRPQSNLLSLRHRGHHAHAHARVRHQSDRAAFEDITVSVSQHLPPGSISDPSRCVSTRGRVPPGSACPARRAALRPGQGSRSSRTGVASPVSGCRAAVWPPLRADGAMQGHGGRYVVTTPLQDQARPRRARRPSGLAAVGQLSHCKQTIAVKYGLVGRCSACSPAGGQRA